MKETLAPSAGEKGVSQDQSRFTDKVYSKQVLSEKLSKSNKIIIKEFLRAERK